ncbi:insulinase family protein [Vallitalea pronyensis]|uniref:Insulinase family protein n=1 Tax=Vallitalea pronyensis TaxID=1348613 RepID=A0A8J8SGV4_9FIRM|nr:insulinase family protein [Vallitalea pronyensis]QUI22784.1 insulinase family protein [Vallitalea pronyensis]
MFFEKDKMYHGFRLIKEEELTELNAVGRLFEHEKSGAKLVSIQNEDNNKVFSVNFRTPPEDHTGLPHIIEHSVLCGSRKFPIKDPFVELVKGSLNTFLNAMTFSDKTMYPVASCNDTDFINLVDVYMDAVFYPNMYHRPEILKQEGWHYDLNNPEEDVTIKGVVYNEMKGAFSSPEQVLFRKIQESLLPDTPYAKESGGDPDHIPELSQEQFLDFHKRYYHPANSYLYIYGDMDVDSTLAWLDEKYLDAFDRIAIDSAIPEQKPFNHIKEEMVEYPISSSESIEGKTYLSYNFVVGKAKDKFLYRAFDILEHILLEAPAAPLKKALIDAGVGKDVFGSFDNSLLQPTFSVVAKNADMDKKELFVTTIRETLENLVTHGIDKKQIEAAINYAEFKIREADYGRYPKGIYYAMMALDSWLYDGDPFMHLQYDETFEKLKEGLESDIFEELIQKAILDNNHGLLLIAEPKKGILTQKDQALKETLRGYKASLTEDEVNQLVKDTINLEKYQSQPDTKEDLEKIPLLDIEDIERVPEQLVLDEQALQNTKILVHETFTNNIAYVKLLFDTKKIPEDLIPYIGLLSRVLGKIDTENYTYGELSNAVNINTGGIHYSINIYGQIGEPDVFMPKFEVDGKCFYEKLPEMFALINETLFTTDLTDKRRLKQIISQSKSRMRMGLTNSGHAAAATRAESYFANTAIYKELTSGITFFHFMDKLEENFDAMADEVIENLIKVRDAIFRSEKLLVSLTAESEGFGLFDEEVKKFIHQLDDSIMEGDDVALEHIKRNEGFLTSDKIQYVAKAGNFINNGFKYSGTLKVLQTVASLDYLWNNVRVKGGAYGCMNGFSRNGNVYFTSYRDPNLKETLETYDNIDGFIKTFDVEEREMTKYIIGTISNLDRPLTPASKGEKALAGYLSNISHEDIIKEREEVLSTTKEAIRETADLVKSVLKQDNICVVGNEHKIEENKELFDDVLHLFR